MYIINPLLSSTLSLSLSSVTPHIYPLYPQQQVRDLRTKVLGLKVINIYDADNKASGQKNRTVVYMYTISVPIIPFRLFRSSEMCEACARDPPSACIYLASGLLRHTQWAQTNNTHTPQTYTFKLAVPGGQKVTLLLESGVRFHTTK